MTSQYAGYMGKAAINDPFLIPKYAVPDPELTMGRRPTSPPHRLDALAHGLAMAVLLPHVMRVFGASAHQAEGGIYFCRLL